MQTIKEIDNDKKLNYYEEIINFNLEEQNYLFIVVSSKRKINIVKMKTNSHELHFKIGFWTRSKTL
jgi:hypothetical protein